MIELLVWLVLGLLVLGLLVLLLAFLGVGVVAVRHLLRNRNRNGEMQ